MSSRFARVPLLALIVYVLAVLIVVFQPQPELAVGSVVTAKDVLLAVGVPEVLVAGNRVEFLMNTILFVPISFVGSFALPRVRWSEWVVIAFVGSGLIEVTQGVLFEARSAQFADLASNTLGGLIGAVAAICLKCVFVSGEKRGRQGVAGSAGVVSVGPDSVGSRHLGG